MDRGSAALAVRVARCAERLAHAARLAALEASGSAPLCGAEYLLDTIDDLDADLRFLRSALRHRIT